MNTKNGTLSTDNRFSPVNNQQKTLNMNQKHIRNYLKLILLFSFIVTNVNAQYTWTQKANFTGSARVWAAAFSIGTKGYVGSGSCASAPFQSTEFWEYNQATNAWTQIASMGGTGRYLAAGMTISSKGYVFTGRDAVGQTQDLWEYNPASNTWTKKKSFPGSSRRSAIAFGIGSKGYCGIGVPLALDFYEYDPATDTWTKKANYPGGGGFAVSNAASFVLGNKGYVGTGCNGSNNNNWNSEFYEYDPATDKWTKKANFGGGARAYTIGFALPGCNKGYIGTGRDASSIYDDIWEYDPILNTWTVVPTSPANFWRQGAVAITIANKAYIGTGADAANIKLNDWWEFVGTCCDSTKLTAQFTNTTVCKGLATAFTNTSTTTVGNIIKNDWSFGDGTTDTIKNPSHTYPDSGTYTVKLVITTDSGCTKTVFQQVKVNTGPVVFAGNDTTLCKGNTATIKATTGLTTYLWTPSTGLSNANIAQPIAAPTTTTTYIVKVTNSNSCTNQDTVKITVDSVSVKASAAVTICSGKNTVLTATSTGTSYTWTPATGLSSATVSNPTASPTITTMYTITVSNANKCTAKDSVKVTVNSCVVTVLNPDFVASDSNICVGTCIKFTDKSTSTNAIQSWNWTFTGAATTSSTQQNPSNICYNTPGVYDVTLKITDITAKDSTITKKSYIKVNPLPVISAGNDTTLCKGNSTTIKATTGFIDYLWTPTAGLSSTTISSPLAKPDTTTSYIVRVTDANKCVNTDTMKIIVDSVKVVASADVTICTGKDTSITVVTNGTLITWTPASGLSNTTIKNPVVKPTATTTYIVTVSNVNSCSSKDSVTVTVDSLPTVKVSQGDSICSGKSVNLSSVATYASVYSWTPAKGLSRTDTSIIIATPDTNTTYLLTVSNLCGVASDSVSIFVNPSPVIDAGRDTVIIVGEKATLHATGTSDYIWSWSPSTALSCNDCPTPIANPTKTITYYLMAMNNGCISEDSVRVIVTEKEQPEALYIPSAFTPNKDLFNEIFYAYGEGIVKFKMTIFNRWGELIFTSNDLAVGWDGTFRNEKVQEEVYVLVAEATTISGKVIKKIGTVTVIR